MKLPILNSRKIRIFAIILAVALICLLALNNSVFKAFDSKGTPQPVQSAASRVILISSSDGSRTIGSANIFGCTQGAVQFVAGNVNCEIDAGSIISNVQVKDETSGLWFNVNLGGGGYPHGVTLKPRVYIFKLQITGNSFAVLQRVDNGFVDITTRGVVH